MKISTYIFYIFSSDFWGIFLGLKPSNRKVAWVALCALDEIVVFLKSPQNQTNPFCFICYFETLFMSQKVFIFLSIVSVFHPTFILRNLFSFLSSIFLSYQGFLSSIIAPSVVGFQSRYFADCWTKYFMNFFPWLV